MWIIVVGVVVILVLVGLLAIASKALEPDGAQDSVEAAPFKAKDWLLTKAERSFFGVLESAVGGRGYRVMCKVRLADLVWLPRGLDASTRTRLLNQVTGKHVDFVILTADALRPVGVVELDDASHSRADRRKRDAFVDRVLGGAGIGVVRIPAKRGYVVADVARAVKGMMA